MRCYRSHVPDLLFEDVRDARVLEIVPYLADPQTIDEHAPLHRMTVFLTYRCNLDCPYCKTIARSEEELRISPQKRETISYAAFEALLDSHGITPIRHIHFTGGEAALVPDLPRMVRLAKAHSVPHVSITSNGALAPAVYEALIASGIDEIRISIDAHEPALGQTLTRRRQAWRQSVATIHAIVAARDAGPPVFIILNTVVGRHNRHQLADIVRFLLAFRPDDIKLITEVQEKRALGVFEGAAAQLEAIAAMLDAYPPDSFPLLRRKLRTVFEAESIGLETVATPPGAAWRCYIPLTERTVDAGFFYPCSVYLREGGAPLGRVDEPQALQRARSAAFVQDHDCRNDPICRSYCLHCTREYNQAANEVCDG
jgi:molybdenum cofactor biosynthesis enzyme MoaA